METSKWCKRIYLRRNARKTIGKVDKNRDVDDRVFGRYYSDGSVTRAADTENRHREAEVEGCWQHEVQRLQQGQAQWTLRFMVACCEECCYSLRQYVI